MTDPRSALFLNKGFISFEELLKMNFQDSSNKMKRIISKNILLFAFFRFFALFRNPNF